MTDQNNQSETTTSSLEPLFNIPKMTGGLLLILIAVHLIRSFIFNDVQDGLALFGYSFIPHRVSNLDWHNINDVLYNAMTAITYMLFHIGWTHFLINTTSLLAFGTAVEKSIGGWRMLGLFLACGVAGILVHYAVYPQSVAPVVGASAAISGLFGAVLRLMQMVGRFKPGWRGLLPITLIWVGMNIVFGLLGVVDDPTVTVAWVAHIGGFMMGLFALPLFMPSLEKN